MRRMKAAYSYTMKMETNPTSVKIYVLGGEPVIL